jgi:hypothetical protein
MTQVSEKHFLRPLEAAKYLAISYHRLKQMTNAGTLRRVKGTKAYLKADLDRLLKGGDADGSTNTEG